VPRGSAKVDKKGAKKDDYEAVRSGVSLVEYLAVKSAAE